MHSLDAEAAKLHQAMRLAEPVSEHEMGVGRLSEGYEVQSILNQGAAADLRRAVGWKIGLTSPAAMSAFGADEPMVGRIFAETVLPDGALLDPALACDPRVEGELLFEVGHLLGPEEDDDALLRSIRTVRPAIEVADSRIIGWASTVALAVADNACCGWVVLPQEGCSPVGLDLPALAMTMQADGDIISRGVGANCMGSPLTVYRWFLRKAAEKSWDVQPGDLILTGAMGPAIPMHPGTTYEAIVSEIGSVSLTFGNNKS